MAEKWNDSMIPLQHLGLLWESVGPGPTPQPHFLGREVCQIEDYQAK